MNSALAHPAIWLIAALSVAGVVARPFRVAEAWWAAGGAGLLLLLGLLPWSAGLAAAAKGSDVYLFLIGMMLLSETARREGLFDVVAALAVNQARRSPKRLFLLVYAVGVAVTVFLSNDATAVVLTPAVFAAARKARADPMPFLLICAFVANAASFALPISNPANLVLYGAHTPALGPWLWRFAGPSLAAILATYGALRWTCASALATPCDCDVDQPALTAGGWTALLAIAATAVALLAVSAFDGPLGLATFLTGALASSLVLIRKRETPWAVLGGVSWSILPLVAGLFILVEAVDRSGLTGLLAGVLHQAVQSSVGSAAAAAGVGIALLSNVINNLPAGLIARTTVAAGQTPRAVVDALLIGVDLGPNLSVTGSLATILWLTAIRREGQHVGFGRFLQVGLLVMPPALVLALAVRLLES